MKDLDITITVEVDEDKDDRTIHRQVADALDTAEIQWKRLESEGEPV